MPPLLSSYPSPLPVPSSLLFSPLPPFLLLLVYVIMQICTGERVFMEHVNDDGGCRCWKSGLFEVYPRDFFLLLHYISFISHFFCILFLIVISFFFYVIYLNSLYFQVCTRERMRVGRLRLCSRGTMGTSRLSQVCIHLTFPLLSFLSFLASVSSCPFFRLSLSLLYLRTYISLDMHMRMAASGTIKHVCSLQVILRSPPSFFILIFVSF